MNIDMSKNKLIYTGSVQKIYEVSYYEDMLVSETTEGGSVFDVGTIFAIRNSDVSRASIRHKIYSCLNNSNCWLELLDNINKSGERKKYFQDNVFEDMLQAFIDKGAKTHHIGMIDKITGEIFIEKFPKEPSNLTLIKKFNIYKPINKSVLKWGYYDYSEFHKVDNYVIPLEYIVRFGITSGSSVLRKYQSLNDEEKIKYVEDLGVDSSIYSWQKFYSPIIDFTTKYEPEDRNITIQEASVLSGINGKLFAKSIVISILGAYMVRYIFEKMGLTLWDLKWEIGKKEEELYIVDTIDTDSVRVTVDFKRDEKIYYVHFNKQAMRDYYKIMHPDWYAAVNYAKKYAEKNKLSFVDVLREGQKNNKYPCNPEVDQEFMLIQEMKMEMISKYLFEYDIDFKKESQRIAEIEVDYYMKKGKRKIYESLNAI
ncbi:MAG: hypothetical protein HGB12_16585 [Bacteroidetes bacterium]|nr:hypothetical protein [Bacteroidota bacterium]